MTAYVVPIVEGQTEQQSVERLLQRVWRELLFAPIRLQVLPPSRGKRDRLAENGQPDLPAKLEEACVKLGPRLADPAARCLILVLIDAEGSCPKELGPSLLSVARAARADVPIACVLPCRMFENWLVASGVNMAGVNGLPDLLPAVVDYEDVHGANWLDGQFRKANPTRKYKKSVDAIALIQRIDLAACRTNSPSFDKLCRELARLVPPPPPSAADDTTPA